MCQLKKLFMHKTVNKTPMLLMSGWMRVLEIHEMSLNFIFCPWNFWCPWKVLEIWDFSNIVHEMSLNYTWCVETLLNLMLNYLQGHQICCLFNYKGLLDCVRRHVPYLNMFCAMWRVLKRLTMVNEFNDYLKVF